MDHQLNSCAFYNIKHGLSASEQGLIRTCTTAKEAWDVLYDSIMGRKSIQHSKFGMIQDQVDEFLMNEDESLEDLYWRLIVLAIELMDHGSKEADDMWVKHKFLKAILPFY